MAAYVLAAASMFVLVRRRTAVAPITGTITGNGEKPAEEPSEATEPDGTDVVLVPTPAPASSWSGSA